MFISFFSGKVMLFYGISLIMKEKSNASALRPRVDDIVKVFKIQKKLCASPQQTIMRASAILRCEGAGAFQYY